MSRHRPCSRSALGLVTCFAAAACGGKSPAQPARRTELAPAPLPVASVDRPPVKVPAELGWLLIGGGAEPLSNQVSLAQDVELAQSLLAGAGLTLFASGPGAQLALVSPSPRGDVGLRGRLSGLFGPPSSPVTRYEAARLHIDGPATRGQVLSTLGVAAAGDGQPLLVYATCHGERGEAPRDSSLDLWGGQGVNVAELSRVLDQAGATRPVRLVVTSCYGGGFAELIFRGADAQGRPALRETCGLFAAPWDDEASGCDPNPDRRAQESYAIHFWHALSGEDRMGGLRRSEIDLDGDGVIGLLEAHTWARIHADSFDIPTNTSERYLRQVVREDRQAVLDAVAAPEEVAVIRALGTELELDTERAARDKLADIDGALDRVVGLVQQAQSVEDDAYQALRIGLLERWPLLEHPWEARTQRMLNVEGPQILRVLTESSLADDHGHAQRGLDALTVRHDGERLVRARVLRLVQAFETLRLASALKARGGEAWASYQRVRRCERWAPPLKQRAR